MLLIFFYMIKFMDYRNFQISVHNLKFLMRGNSTFLPNTQPDKGGGANFQPCKYGRKYGKF